MRFQNMLSVIDSHTAGEMTRLVISGFPPVPGKTMMEKVEYFTKKYGFFMKALTQEPRGTHGVGFLLTDPTTEDGDFGVITSMLPGMMPSMCIHGIIGVVTSLIEAGFVAPKEPVTAVKLDMPIGQVNARAYVRNGVCESVTVQNVPCFLMKSITIDLPWIGTIPVDIAFGGMLFAIMKSDDIKTKVELENIDGVTKVMLAARPLIEAQTRGLTHPEYQNRPLSLVCTIAYDKPAKFGAHIKSCTMKSNGHWDRSPCGTGTCALMGMEYGYGRLSLNQELINESMIGTTFAGKLVSRTKVGKYDAAIPEVTGSAYITGMSTLIIDPRDPFKYGFEFDPSLYK